MAAGTDAVEQLAAHRLLDALAGKELGRLALARGPPERGICRAQGQDVAAAVGERQADRRAPGVCALPAGT